MISKICEKVSVNFVYNHINNTLLPKYLKWQNRVYVIQKLGLHYTLYRGSTLFHMFAVNSEDKYFLLSLDTDNLHWQLEEIADNLTN